MANIPARQALINDLETKLAALQSERSKFGAKSKAAAVVALDTQIANATARIALLRSKLDKATVVDNDTGSVHVKSPLQEAVEQLQSAQDRVLHIAGTSSPMRYIASMATSLVVGAVAGWAAYVAVNWITAAALMLTGSVFLAFIVQILAFIASLIAGGKVMSASYDYIANEVVDSHFKLAKCWLGVKYEQAKGMFTSEPSVVAAR